MLIAPLAGSLTVRRLDGAHGVLIQPLTAEGRPIGKPKSVTPFVRHHGKFDDMLKDNNVAVLEYDRALAVITNTALQTEIQAYETLSQVGQSFVRGRSGL